MKSAQICVGTFVKNNDKRRRQKTSPAFTVTEKAGGVCRQN